MFTVSGVKVATIFEGNADAGRLYNATFNSGELAAGFYLYKMKTNDSVITNKVLLVR